MKLLRIIALMICIQQPLIQSETVDSISSEYAKGAITGALFTCAAAFISLGIVSIYNTRVINNTAAHKTKTKMVTSLHNQAEDTLSKGITAIALGAAFGIATGLALYTNTLSPMPLSTLEKR